VSSPLVHRSHGAIRVQLQSVILKHLIVSKTFVLLLLLSSLYEALRDVRDIAGHTPPSFLVPSEDRFGRASMRSCKKRRPHTKQVLTRNSSGTFTPRDPRYSSPNFGS
ncbi:unnamed protein product, partial [Ectocarpus sp. 13 AM-2016]